MPGLVPIDGAGETCVPASFLYVLVPQANHGCLFFGTPNTVAAIEQIADTFVARQIACRNDAGDEACIIGDPQDNDSVAIKGDPLRMRITAMSLP